MKQINLAVNLNEVVLPAHTNDQSNAEMLNFVRFKDVPFNIQILISSFSTILYLFCTFDEK